MALAPQDVAASLAQASTERDLLKSFTRIPVRDDGYRFEVGIVTWSHPHEPDADWKCFRRWKSAPLPERIAAAEKAVLANRRYFRRCAPAGN